MNLNNKLKIVLKDACISHQEISDELGIKSLGTISLKVNGKAEFSTTEAMKLKKLINKKTGRDYTFEDLFTPDENADEVILERSN